MASHNFFEQEKIYLLPKLISFREIKIADIGCGSGDFLKWIYSELKEDISKFVSIDSDINNELDVHNNNMADHLNSFCNEQNTIPRELGCFKRIDGKEFLQHDEALYDLIMFKNVLHFVCWNEIQEWINLSVNRLSDRGFIYIDMAGENHDFRYPYWKTKLNEEKTKELKAIYNVSLCEFISSHYRIIIQKP